MEIIPTPLHKPGAKPKSISHDLRLKSKNGSFIYANQSSSENQNRQFKKKSKSENAWFQKNAFKKMHANRAKYGH